jgi:hypothetical protein
MGPGYMTPDSKGSKSAKRSLYETLKYFSEFTTTITITTTTTTTTTTATTTIAAGHQASNPAEPILGSRITPQLQQDIKAL